MTWKKKLSLSLGLVFVIGLVFFWGIRAFNYPDDSAQRVTQQVTKNWKKKNEVLVFYRPGCSDCAKVKNTILWAKLQVKLLDGTEDINFINTDHPENKQMISQYSVTTVPTVIRINKDQKVARYSGTNRDKLSKIILGGA